MSKIKNVNVDEEKDINILLLGSTGVGKSTFINSIANYLTFSDLRIAEAEDPIVLIPTIFTIIDKNRKPQKVSIGVDDRNEYLDVGESATQDVKTYVFPILNGQKKLRLIDTPGVGDTRGIIHDNENTDNILIFIAQLHKLHAICFFMKPNESRSTAYFKYCMSQILSNLDKSASKNIVFLFTNTRGSDYSPGETESVLKKTIDTIQKRPPYCEIPFGPNIFCFENDCFKYLAAVKEGVEFDNKYTEKMCESWDISMEQCWALIKYIVGDSSDSALRPHLVKSTSAINEARRMISHLTKPLAEISQLINQNVALLNKHKRDINMAKDSIKDLNSKLYMPVASLEVNELSEPVTVCTFKDCAEFYKVGDKTNWHYKQRCHDPCYLKDVPKEVIGSPLLAYCSAMSSNICEKCGCSFLVHMHVYYMTEVKEDREIDDNVKKNIDSTEKVLERTKKLLRDMEKRKEELEDEHTTIIECCAKFAHFLQNNAITPYNDGYKEYIRFLIDQEKSLGNECDTNTIDVLNKLLRQYDEMKRSFDTALQLKLDQNSQEVIVTPEQIQEIIRKLYFLKHNGKKIRELYECQQRSRRREFENKEYIHTRPLITKSRRDKLPGAISKKQQNQQPKGVSITQQFRSLFRGNTVNEVQTSSQCPEAQNSADLPPSYEESQQVQAIQTSTCLLHEATNSRSPGPSNAQSGNSQKSSESGDENEPSVSFSLI